MHRSNSCCQRKWSLLQPGEHGSSSNRSGLDRFASAINSAFVRDRPSDKLSTIDFLKASFRGFTGTGTAYVRLSGDLDANSECKAPLELLVVVSRSGKNLGDVEPVTGRR